MDTIGDIIAIAFFAAFTLFFFLPVISDGIGNSLKDRKKLRKEIEEANRYKEDLKKKQEQLADKEKEYQNLTEFHQAFDQEKLDFYKAMGMFDRERSLALKHLKSNIKEQYNIDAFFESIIRGRLYNADRTDLEIIDLDVNTTMRSGNHSFEVSLAKCGCSDFQRHPGKPCKHMLYLAYSLGIMQLYPEMHDKTLKNIRTILDEKVKEKKKLESNIKELRK
ncbi:MAG: SWIM zinc finger family protein [Clostridia bacterium]|nr:SWIM zinc finger family protein [Clostridia bacterium]